MRCTCKFCCNIDYDNSAFFVDPTHLQKDRPIGVTGLLRVKNDAEFLSLCIDSCIEALDELIIVYQECDDNSPEIIEQKRRQYPDKIKSFFYRPKVLSHNLSEEEFTYASTLPSTSIHLLCNYYNYALSKATFCYALKIDADQIYFTDKLKMICDSYRRGTKERVTVFERLAAIHLYIFANITQILPKPIASRIKCIVPSNKQVEAYRNYVIKSIINNKNPTSFSGINLLYADNKWQLPLSNYAQGLFPPFNGINDTYIFKIDIDTYFTSQPIQSENVKYNRTIIEVFNKNKSLRLYKSIFKPSLLYGGFLWYHVAPLKKSVYPQKLSEYRNKLAPLFSSHISYRSIEQQLPTPLRRWMRGWYKLFWDYEQSVLPTQYLSQISHIIQTYHTDD